MAYCSSEISFPDEERAVAYEVHLHGEEAWIVLHDGVEEARFVHAKEALAYVMRRLAEEGEDAWDFDLGFRYGSPAPAAPRPPLALIEKSIGSDAQPYRPETSAAMSGTRPTRGRLEPPAGSGGSGLRVVANGPRVLVVDDEPQVCELISDALAEAALQVECVQSDHEAYDAIRRDGYAALLVDVNLGPGTTGFDVARYARKRKPSLAVIYVSGQASERSFAAFGVPGSVFIAKPFRPSELAERLVDLLRS